MTQHDPPAPTNLRLCRNVQFRYEYFDRHGRPLESNQGWRFQRVDALAQVFLDGNALETTAWDWRLHVRPAR